jgi:hypothetical protein
MLQKILSPYCSNLIFADVLNNSHMNQMIEMLRYEKYKGRSQIWEP